MRFQHTLTQRRQVVNLHVHRLHVHVEENEVFGSGTSHRLHNTLLDVRNAILLTDLIGASKDHQVFHTSEGFDLKPKLPVFHTEVYHSISSDRRLAHFCKYMSQCFFYNLSICRGWDVSKRSRRVVRDQFLGLYNGGNQFVVVTDAAIKFGVFIQTSR